MNNIFQEAKAEYTVDKEVVNLEVTSQPNKQLQSKKKCSC